jgi:hypothetical protein
LIDADSEAIDDHVEALGQNVFSIGITTPSVS